MRNAILTLALVLSLTTTASADTYLRKDCANNGDGTSWACATSGGGVGAKNNFTCLGANADCSTPKAQDCASGSYTWLRGTTYYVMGSDNAYSGLCFRNSSGTGVVSIRKATEGECSAQTGWDNVTSGEKAAQAKLGGISSRTFHDLTIDGVTGSGYSGYGFKIDKTHEPIAVAAAYLHDRWTIKHMELTNRGVSSPWSCYANPPTDNTYICDAGVYGIGPSGSYSTGWVIDNNYIHHVGICARMTRLKDSEFKNNVCRYNDYDTENHNPMLIINGADNVLIEANMFEDAEGTTIIGTPGPGADTTTNITIRNNVFWDNPDNPENRTGTGTGEGAISSWDDVDVVSGWKIYNNTFYLSRSGSQLEFGTVGTNNGGMESKNNLWYCDQPSCTSAAAHGTITLSNNGFFGNAASASETNKVILAASSPFTAIGTDWSLASCSGDNCAIDKGADLSASFTLDRAGNTRPSGSAFDLGAYEYGGVDYTPAAFSFTDNTGVALVVTVYSTSVQVLAIDNGCSITLTGDASCRYQLNGAGDWLASGDNVVLNDNVALRATSSGSYSTAVSCTLNLGGVSDTWNVTTLAAIVDPAAPRNRGSFRGNKR